MLVDVRDSKAFARFRIAGSLNIDSQSLERKRFLKNRKIVLVDEGHSYTHLEALCQSLRESGFSEVYILDGGLNAWQKEIEPLVGNRDLLNSLNRISPSQYFKERHFSHWKLVDLEDVSESQDLQDGGSLRALSLVSNVETIRERLVREAASDEQNDPQLYLLIVTKDGSGFDQFQQALEKTDLTHAYFLEGGRRGYERFLRSQQQMLTYRHRIPDWKGCGGVD